LPLNLTKDIVMMRSSEYDYTGTEEVLAELTEQLKVFPPAQRNKKYEVAERKGVVKCIMRIKLKDKEVKLRSLARCRGPASSNSCPGGVLDYPVVLCFCDYLYFPPENVCVPHIKILFCTAWPISFCIPVCPG
jgi:hypothetical protein